MCLKTSCEEVWIQENEAKKGFSKIGQRIAERNR